MPRNAEGVKVEGSDTPGGEEEERSGEGKKVKTKKKKRNQQGYTIFYSREN